MARSEPPPLAHRTLAPVLPKGEPMTTDLLPPRAVAALASVVLALSAAPALHAQAPADTGYSLLNHTGAALSCRYRVGKEPWQARRSISAQGELAVPAGSADETLIVDCMPQTRNTFTIQAGEKYRAVRESGTIVVRRVNA